MRRIVGLLALGGTLAGLVALSKQEESGLVKHARTELDLLMGDEDDMDRMMKRDVLHVVKAFSAAGFSGMFAGVAIPWLQRLLNHKTLRALTGEDSEWCDQSEYGLSPGQVKIEQNVRCSSVFRETCTDGTVICYDVDGRYFVDGEDAWTGTGCCTPVTFPYRPPEKREAVDVSGKTEEERDEIAQQFHKEVFGDTREAQQVDA